MDEMCECCDDEIAVITCPTCGMLLCEMCAEDHECEEEF